MASEAFLALLDELERLHEAKDADYSRPGESLSNFYEASALGVRPSLGVLVRMSDKWSRIKTLVSRPPQVETETLRDTVIDLAAYSLIFVALLDEETDAESALEGSNGFEPGVEEDSYSLPVDIGPPRCPCRVCKSENYHECCE